MNLALHGFLLQVILSIIDIKYGLCSAGEPGYLDFDNLPETNFSCQGKVIGGYYADVEAGCQMFHVCTIGQKDEIMDIKFLCLNGTVFDQETRVCERVDEVDCSKSERFYNLNLELYGNNAVTLSLQESPNDDEPPILIEDHHQTTSPRPSTTTSTTTTPRPAISSTTSPSNHYQHSNGYPQPFQHHLPFSSVQTSQSKSHYDDKNGGYHRQYIYHNGDQNDQNDDNNDDNQATSYQLFSNQGGSSTIRNSQIQLSTVSPLYHATSSTLQSLLNGNGNQPLINPLYHNHGIISTTEQFTVHNNNPRETPDYQRNNGHVMHSKSEERTLLEPIQSTSQGKVSKLTISPVPDTEKLNHKIKTETSQQQLSGGFLTIAPSDTGPPTVRSFYPTPKTSKSETSTTRVTQHIHLPPPPVIPQLKPHQVTIHLSPPEIQRLVQNPSPLLPSQSRVIVTAKASVSDESGRPLNSTQLVTLPLPTIPASYDDYKEGDESFDPFYRDVPKIRNSRKSGNRFSIILGQPRKKRMAPLKREADVDEREINIDESSVDVEKLYDQEYEETTDEPADTTVEADRSDVTSGEDTVSQQTDNYATEEEYDDQYSNESDKPIEMNSLENDNSTEEDSRRSSEDVRYDSEEYLLSEEVDDNKNSTSAEYFDEPEYPITTDEPEAAVTETSVAPDQTEMTTVESNKTTEDTVLKFTEEIPESEKKEIQEDPKVVVVDIPDVSQDYVDDNYEPESYKGTVQPEMISTTDEEGVTESRTQESSTERVVETSSETIATTSSTTPSTPIESTTMDIITTTSSTTPSPTTILSTPLPIIPTSSTTLSTTSKIPKSSSTTSSPSVTKRRYTTPSTTVYRPTAPKIKSFPTRKTYVYNPPTTTPVPVVIKTRLPLFNPNPAKPPRSYNELAPKPVIRKRPLHARRVSTTVTEEEEPEEITTTTEFITTTNSSLLEVTITENIENTTEKKNEVLSEKQLERISEALGEQIIEQINDLTTTTSDSNDFVEMVTSTSSTPSSTNLSSQVQDMNRIPEMTTEGTINEDVTTPIIQMTMSLEDLGIVTSSPLASVLPVKRKPMVTYKRVNGFNCLDKEMYRFYADKRDCRLFHYCSPGFTERQVLDFRFVCEEGTSFDEETQSCLHEVKNVKCREKTW